MIARPLCARHIDVLEAKTSLAFLCLARICITTDQPLPAPGRALHPTYMTKFCLVPRTPTVHALAFNLNLELSANILTLQDAPVTEILLDHGDC